MEQTLLHMRLPERYRCLSGSALKLNATIFMLIDHVNHHLFAHMPHFYQMVFAVGEHKMTLTTLLYSLCRPVFPLYCFLLVEGFLHTHDARRYARNLFVFALVSTIPWNLEHSGKPFVFDSLNVFFTLFLGLVALIALGAWRERGAKMGELVLPAGALAATTAIAEVLNTDYGGRGVLLIFLLYVLRDMPIARAVVGCAILRSHLWALPSFMLMELYNGERGFVSGGVLKYAFYAFYPAHILVIALIKMHLGYV